MRSGHQNDLMDLTKLQGLGCPRGNPKFYCTTSLGEFALTAWLFGTRRQNEHSYRHIDHYHARS